MTLVTLTIASLASCYPEDIIIDIKNNCFEKELVDLKTRHIYKSALTSFKDTLKIVQAASKSLLEEKADDGVFFKKDSLECLTFVLARGKREFGSVRVWRGQLTNGQWKWSKSMSVGFSESYFEKYENNTFDNISKLARYSILTSGDATLGGCDLDEYYWFTYLKN